MARPHVVSGSERPGVATAPPEVQRLLTLTIVSAGVHLFLRIIGLFATADAPADHLGHSRPAHEAVAEQSAGTGITSGEVGLALAMAGYAVLYVLLAQGRNRARVLGTVLAGISAVAAVLGLLGALAHGRLGGILLPLGVLLALVNVRWMVVAAEAPVRDWFAGRGTA